MNWPTRWIATPLLLALAASLALAQTPAFQAADIHPNTHRGYHYLHGGDLTAGRYALTDATMIDLIATAYSVDPNRVLGGPAWLELDRYDLDAKAPPATSPATLQLMLQNLLATRFRLALRAASSPPRPSSSPSAPPRTNSSRPPTPTPPPPATTNRRSPRTPPASPSLPLPTHSAPATT
jgi:hypothetical protein